MFWNRTSSWGSRYESEQLSWKLCQCRTPWVTHSPMRSSSSEQCVRPSSHLNLLAGQPLGIPSFLQHLSLIPPVILSVFVGALRPTEGFLTRCGGEGWWQGNQDVNVPISSVWSWPELIVWLSLGSRGWYFFSHHVLCKTPAPDSGHGQPTHSGSDWVL